MNPEAKAFPEWVTPMAATLTQERFIGPEWIFERKYDGIRLLAFKNGDDVKLYSRNRLLQNYPKFGCMANLPVHDVILDGEAAWDSTSDGAYHIFDILWLNGRSVMALPFESRRALLRDLKLRAPLVPVQEVTGDKPWEHACSKGWEGVIAKLRASSYEYRRSPHWLKMKCEASQELVVGGFTDPQGSRVGFGALLVGYFDKDDFVFAGNSARALTPSYCWNCVSAWISSRSPSRHSLEQQDCRACALIGCGPRSSCKWRSSNGPCTASCAIRACEAFATTSRREMSLGKRDSRRRPVEGAVLKYREIQRRVLLPLGEGGAKRRMRVPRPPSPALRAPSPRRERDSLLKRFAEIHQCTVKNCAMRSGELPARSKASFDRLCAKTLLM